jgi:CO/xanthine dehydrogenase FAD-binding subunit
MDLNTIREVKRPASTDELMDWPKGHAWLAGGTWLFSEPQLAIDTLVDLEALGWRSLDASPEGLDIATTCRIAELEHFAAPPEWIAAPLLRECCHALLMSFKIANEATVGGNICMSLPAGAMISLTVALEAVYTLLPRDGVAREVKAIDFVTANHANVLAPGELLRAIHIPASALSKRFAFRRASLTRFGRSAAFLIGTCDDKAEDFLLTITAATPCPVQLHFQHMPSTEVLRRTIDDCIPHGGYFDDVHGTPAYKRHLTYHFAEQIRSELATLGAGP